MFNQLILSSSKNQNSVPLPVPPLVSRQGFTANYSFGVSTATCFHIVWIMPSLGASPLKRSFFNYW